MDTNLLRYYVRRNGDTHWKLAQAIGIGESTLYRKLRGDDSEFTQSEIQKIVKRYNLTAEETMKIFFVGE